MKKLSLTFKLTGLYVLSIFLSVSTSLIFAQEAKMDTNVPMDWCIFPKSKRSVQQLEGITGGNNGRVVHATSRFDFGYLRSSEEDIVIFAEGSFGDVVVASNKTLIGKAVRKETVLGSNHTIRVKTLPRGVYYISLIGKQEKIVRKFIKS